MPFQVLGSWSAGEEGHRLYGLEPCCVGVVTVAKVVISACSAMATKQAPKGGSGEQKKVAAPPHNAKEKESPKELIKDDKANPKAGGKDPPKESKDANKKPMKEDKKEKEPVQSGSSSGGGQERGRSGRQDDHARGKDRATRTPRDRPDHRTQDKDGREVCRNFLHNRCDRGSLCKYYHPRSTSRPRHGPDDPEHRRNSPTRAPGSGGGQIICRDFIRNMCSRGTECRFYHPPTETTTKKRQGSWLTFCHDFRNGHCVRNDCRLVVLPTRTVTPHNPNTPQPHHSYLPYLNPPYHYPLHHHHHSHHLPLPTLSVLP